MILKYISTLFNKIINSNIAIYIILGVIIYLLYTSNVSLRNNVNRLESNQIALTTEYSRQIEVSKSTFKQLFHKEDSIANLINIKTKTIENVVVNNYHYKDTTIVSFPLTKKDSLSKNNDTLQFVANMGCMLINGEVIKSTNTINIKDKDYRDVLYTYLYEAYDSRFLGFLWKTGKHIDAKTYSECMQDTVSIERNIKIIK
jgi:hypothetical protein